MDNTVALSKIFKSSREKLNWLINRTRFNFSWTSCRNYLWNVKCFKELNVHLRSLHIPQKNNNKSPVRLKERYCWRTFSLGLACCCCERTRACVHCDMAPVSLMCLINHWNCGTCWTTLQVKRNWLIYGLPVSSDSNWSCATAVIIFGWLINSKWMEWTAAVYCWMELNTNNTTTAVQTLQAKPF